MHYEVTTAGERGKARETTTVFLRDASGADVTTASGSTGTLVVENAQLWSPENPYLYTMQVPHSSGDDVDTYSLRVGIRTIRVDGTRSLFNGKPVHLRGFGMHEDVPWRGKGHDDARMVRDFALMRWIGANSFRTSHYPYAEEVLDLADELGVLVIDETAAVGLNLVLNSDRVHIEDTRTFRPGGVESGDRQSQGGLHP